MFDELPCTALNTSAMSEDQLLEVPGKKPIERLSRQISMDERKPDVQRHAPARRLYAGKPEKGIANRLTGGDRMVLDQIVEDHGAGFSMEEKNFFDQGVSSECKLIEVVGPIARRRIA